MVSDPSPSGDTGRDERGRFGVGNRAGKGNPMARRVQRLRVELLREVSVDDLRKIIRALIDSARAGDVAAAREVFDRTLGRASEGIDIAERLAVLEELLAQVAERRTRW